MKKTFFLSFFLILCISSCDKKQLDEINSKIDGQITNLSRADSSLSSLQNRYSTLSEKLSQTDLQIQGLRDSIKTLLSSSTDYMKSEIDQLKSKCDSLDSVSRLINEELSEISKKTTDLNDSLSSLHSSFGEKIKIFADSLSSAQNKLSKLDSLLGDINQDCLLIEKRVKEQSDSIQTMFDRLSSVEIIPSYSDGSIDVAVDGGSKVYVRVLPLENMDKIIDLFNQGEADFTLNVLSLSTKAPEIISFEITTVSKEEDCLLVETPALTALDASKSYMACIEFSFEKYSVSTPYIGINLQ